MSFFRQPNSKKPVSLLLILCLFCTIGGVVFFPPSEAKAVWGVGDTVIEMNPIIVGPQPMSMAGVMLKDAAEETLLETPTNILLNLTLHVLLAELTNNIIAWIQSGFDRHAFMREGWSEFFTNVADNVGGWFIDQYLGAGWLCEPFDLDIKLALLEIPTFAETSKCSISDMLAAQNQTLENFYNDFSAGGWAGWIELSKPQNNFYGSYLMALEEKQKQVAEAEMEMQKEIEWGQGYLSVKECRWYNTATGKLVAKKEGVGIMQDPAECRTPSTPGHTPPYCKKECITITPGSVFDLMFDTTIIQPYSTLAAQVGGIWANMEGAALTVLAPYLTAISQALFNQILQEGVGLFRAAFVSVPEGGSAGSITNPDIAGIAEAGLMCDEAQGGGQTCDPNASEACAAGQECISCTYENLSGQNQGAIPNCYKCVSTDGSCIYKYQQLAARVCADIPGQSCQLGSVSGCDGTEHCVQCSYNGQNISSCRRCKPEGETCELTSELPEPSGGSEATVPGSGTLPATWPDGTPVAGEAVVRCDQLSSPADDALCASWAQERNLPHPPWGGCDRCWLVSGGAAVCGGRNLPGCRE